MFDQLLPQRLRKDKEKIFNILLEHRTQRGFFESLEVHRMVEKIIARTGWNWDIFNPIAGSFMNLTEKRIYNEDVDNLALKIAGCLEHFHSGNTFLDKWNKERVDLLCIGVIDRVEPELDFMIISGPDAGEGLKKSVSFDYAKWLLWKSGNFFRGEKMAHPRRMFGSWFTGTLIRNDDNLKLIKLHSSDKQKSRNSRRKRERVEYECGIRANKIAEECELCPMSINRCKYSTHAEDWKLEECNKHNKMWNDNNGCILCRITKLVLKTDYEIEQ